MLEGLMGKMNEQMGDAHKRLNGMFVEGVAEGGLVRVKANGNKKVLEITISDELMDDREAIEELTLVAINRAIEQAEKLFEKEMGGVSKGMLPDLSGLF